MEPLRYGIVGVGQIATQGHIPELRALEEARLVAVATRSAATRSRLRHELRDLQGVYGSFDDLLRDDTVEAVLIATPNWLHTEQLIAALDAGKHVFVEKPIGTNADEIERAKAAVRAAPGRVVQVGHELRSSSLMQTVRGILTSGEIGEPKLATIREHRKPLLPGWRQHEGSGGIMLEKNSHFFDLFNLVFARSPVFVQGVGSNLVNHDSPLLDHCFVTVDYDGATAALEMCLFAEQGSQLTLDIVGDDGRIIALFEDYEVRVFSRASPEPRIRALVRDGAFHPGMRRQHQRFVRTVREGAENVCGIDAAYETAQLSLAAEEAVRTGQRVSLRE